MKGIKRSIEKTISYAEFFHFPVRNDDIYLWLISPVKISRRIIDRLGTHKLTPKEEKFRKQRTLSSVEKITSSQNIISILSNIPTIKLISVTGSVAINNSRFEDDVDLMIVTTDHTLWITRAFVTLVVSLLGRKRSPGSSYQAASNTLCLNLWLEESTMKIPKNKRNLYTAHEVLQTLPVFDRGQYYQTFLFVNRWTKKYLANAFFEKTKVANKHISKQKRWSVLSYLLYPINYLAFTAQSMYMQPKITTESVSLTSAYFHKIDFSNKIDRFLENK